jgi:hypothetical protein
MPRLLSSAAMARKDVAASPALISAMIGCKSAARRAP